MIHLKWMKSNIVQRENKMRARTENRKQKSCCEVLICPLKISKKISSNKLFLTLVQSSHDDGV